MTSPQISNFLTPFPPLSPCVTFWLYNPLEVTSLQTKLYFEIEIYMTGSIFVPQPWNIAKFAIDITIIFWYIYI